MKEESVHLGGARIRGSIFSKALGDCCPTLDHSNFKATSAGDTPAPAPMEGGYFVGTLQKRAVHVGFAHDYQIIGGGRGTGIQRSPIL